LCYSCELKEQKIRYIKWIKNLPNSNYYSLNNEYKNVVKLLDTERGICGFGKTGKK